MKVFSFIGASNTGKSTVFEALKQQLDSDNVTFVEEHARVLASQGHKLDHTIEHKTQCRILEFYLRCLLESRLQEDWTLVTDRNILDTFAYSVLNYISGKFTTKEFLEQKKIFEAGLEVSKDVTYILFPISEHITLNNDGVRLIDEDFRNRVEDTCEVLLEQHNQMVYTLQPDKPYLEQVLDIMNNPFNPQ